MLKVPEIIPVPLLTLSPVGRPVALNVNGSPSGSAPESRREITSPLAFVWLPGLCKTIAGVTVQEKDWLLLWPASLAVTVTMYGAINSA